MQPAHQFSQATDLASIRERLAVWFGKNRDKERPDPVGQFGGSFLGDSTVVDSHILRVLERLGFVGIRADSKTAYDAVMAAADDLDDLLELQWQLKSLGQTICTHAQALCISCPLSDICRHRMGSIETLRRFLDRSELKEAPVRTPLGHSEIDLCLKGGLLHGVLHEVFSVIGHEAAATGFVAGLATRIIADKQLLWIKQDFSTYEFGEISPTGLLELGLDPTRILLLGVANTSDGLRAANDALSCAALGAVVIEIPGSPKILDLVASRRLTLAATQKLVTTFLLRLGAEPDASTAETRWLVRSASSQTPDDDWGFPVFEASLVRNRHGKTGSWLVEWNCDAYCFQAPAQDRGPVVSAPSH